MKKLFALFLVLLIAFLIIGFTLSAAQQPQLPETLQNSLTEIALASLKTEYDVLLTGNAPPMELIPRRDGMTRMHLTGKDRVVTALRLRQGAFDSGMRYANITVELKLIGIEQHGDKIILRAIEESTEQFERDGRPHPIVTEMRSEHNFIFSVEPVSPDRTEKSFSIQVGGFVYVLLEDVTEPQSFDSSNDFSSQNPGK